MVKSIIKSNCFIETHTIAGSEENVNRNIPVSVFLETTTPQTVFEDFTNNHNKALIQLFVVGMSAPAQTKIFQVEDFQSLTLTRQEGPTSLVSLFVQKTFCICCNENNNSCDEYYYDCD
ncbi:TPA: hypothetical protein QCX86_004096 [Bacillus wiedmannii]|nr:hypothetical protein [Bacillus wiedmannii]